MVEAFPAPGQHDEAVGLIGAFDDLDLGMLEGGFEAGLELSALVAAIGAELQQEGVEAEQAGRSLWAGR